MKDSSRALNGLQIMRGIAASLVLWHHCLEESKYVSYAGAPPEWLIRIGAAGVDIFFVISGFIMMYTNFANGKECLTPTQFVKRRFLRIYPLYWVCCCLVLGLRAFGLFSAAQIAPDYLLNSLLLLPLRSHLLLGPAWTLVFEIYFYLLFAVALRSRAASWTLVGTTALITLIYLAAPWAPTQELSKFLQSELPFEFCFGLVLGYLATRDNISIPRIFRYAWAPASLIAIVLTSVLPSPSTAGLATTSQRLLVWGIPASFIILAAASWRPSLRTALARAALLLGDASYAIYLTHAFAMISYAVLLRKVPFLTSLNQWPVTTAVFFAALVLGVVTHLTIEKALTRLTHRRFARQVGVGA